MKGVIMSLSKTKSLVLGSDLLKDERVQEEIAGNIISVIKSILSLYQHQRIQLAELLHSQSIRQLLSLIDLIQQI